MDIGAWARVRLNELKDRRIRVNVLTPGQVATAALCRTPTTRAGHLMTNTSIIGTGNMGRDQSKAADLAKALGGGAPTGEWDTAPAGDIVSTVGRAATRVSCLQKRGLSCGSGSEKKALGGTGGTHAGPHVRSVTRTAGPKNR